MADTLVPFRIALGRVILLKAPTLITFYCKKLQNGEHKEKKNNEEEIPNDVKTQTNLVKRKFFLKKSVKFK